MNKGNCCKTLKYTVKLNHALKYIAKLYETQIISKELPIAISLKRCDHLKLRTALLLSLFLIINISICGSEAVIEIHSAAPTNFSRYTKYSLRSDMATHGLQLMNYDKGPGKADELFSMEMKRLGYVLVDEKDADFHADLTVWHWGVVLSAEPDRVYKEAVVAIIVTLRDNNGRVIWRGTGKDFDSANPTDERLSQLGQTVVSKLAAWICAFKYEPVGINDL